MYFCLNPSSVILTITSFLFSASLTLSSAKCNFFFSFLCFLLLVILNAVCLYFLLFMLNCLWLRQVAFLLHVSPCLALFCTIHTFLWKGTDFLRFLFLLGIFSIGSLSRLNFGKAELINLFYCSSFPSWKTGTHFIVSSTFPPYILNWFLPASWN